MLYITLIIREILRVLGALRPIFQNIAYFYSLFGPEILIPEVHYIKYECIPRNLEIYNSINTSNQMHFFRY